MAKQGTRAEVNTFVKGLITEASPLNFPANASLDEENFELNRDGTRDRRLGLDLEVNAAIFSTPASLADFVGSQPTTYKWFSVAGDSSKEFLVVRILGYLYFYDYAANYLSRDGYLGTLTLPYDPRATYSFASVDGKLIIAAGVDTVSVVTYEPTNPSGPFVRTDASLKVRDLWGVEELDPRYEGDVTFRGNTDDRHNYNLQNQSWGIPRKNKEGTLINPLAAYLSIDGKYPSNSEVVWTGLQFQPIVTTNDEQSDPFERIFPNLYQDRFGADVKAAKGYYIIDLLRRGSSRNAAQIANNAKYPEIPVSGSLPADTTPDGATIVTEFAGRVFFAGFNGQVIGGDSRSPNLANYVLFSQLVKSVGDVSKCYQEGDPTSRSSNDIIDTDGGFFRLAGAKRIIAMRNLGANLVIMADNGVWSVTGGNNYGFSATNYKVDKISAYGCISASSVVIEGSRLVFWAEDGIYIVGKDQYGDFQVDNVAAQTIQTLYENIPNTSKENAFGSYDLANKKIRWVYKTGDPFTSTSVTKELVLDTVIGCFYQNRISRIPTNDYEVYNIFTSTTFKRGSEFSPVLVGSDAVYDDDDPVGIKQTIRVSGFQASSYLIMKREPSNQMSFTFGNYRDLEFRDWKSANGVGEDAPAYLLTGALTAGDSAIAKQAPYITMHFRRTEVGVDADLVPLNQSSCIMRSQWDWANSILSKKWGSEFQAYKYRLPRFAEDSSDDFDNGFETVVTKNKLRGRGKALSLHFRTEPYRDCRILGWSLTINGNAIT